MDRVFKNYMPITGAQVRIARAALDWTVRRLAQATGLHRNTINNFELGRSAGDPATLAKIERALRIRGIEFIDENGGGVGVRLGCAPDHMPGIAVRSRYVLYDESDAHILRRLGGALVVLWKQLPAAQQDLLVSQATLMGDREDVVGLRTLIENFIEKAEVVG